MKEYTEQDYLVACLKGLANQTYLEQGQVVRQTMTFRAWRAREQARDQLRDYLRARLGPGSLACSKNLTAQVKTG